MRALLEVSIQSSYLLPVPSTLGVAPKDEDVDEAKEEDVQPQEAEAEDVAKALEARALEKGHRHILHLPHLSAVTDSKSASERLSSPPSPNLELQSASAVARKATLARTAPTSPRTSGNALVKTLHT